MALFTTKVCRLLHISASIWLPTFFFHAHCFSQIFYTSLIICRDFRFIQPPHVFCICIMHVTRFHSVLPISWTSVYYWIEIS